MIGAIEGTQPRTPAAPPRVAGWDAKAGKERGMARYINETRRQLLRRVGVGRLVDVRA